MSLLSNACVTMLLTTQLSIPHLSIRANGGGKIDMENVDAILKHTETVFTKYPVFSTRWDLRLAPVPSWTVVTKCIRWAFQHRTQLNQNQRLTIIVPPGKLASMIAFVLRSVGPSCPTYIGGNVTEADAFEAT